MTIEQTRRHPNGGAQKIGLEVHVSADSYCDYPSVIKGCSGIFSSTLLSGLVEDGQVFKSTLDRTVISKSTIVESSCLRLCALDVILHKVDIIAEAEYIVLKDVVAENCKLYGNWTLEGNARIPCGTWYRAPRYLRITGENGVDVGLTESTDGHALMACWRKPITQWLKAGPRLGVKHGWSNDQINDARHFFEMLADCPLGSANTGS